MSLLLFSPTMPGTVAKWLGLRLPRVGQSCIQRAIEAHRMAQSRGGFSSFSGLPSAAQLSVVCAAQKLPGRVAQDFAVVLWPHVRQGDVAICCQYSVKQCESQWLGGTGLWELEVARCMARRHGCLLPLLHDNVYGSTAQQHRLYGFRRIATCQKGLQCCLLSLLHNKVHGTVAFWFLSCYMSTGAAHCLPPAANGASKNPWHNGTGFWVLRWQGVGQRNMTVCCHCCMTTYMPQRHSGTVA